MAFLTNRIIAENIMQSGYKTFISKQGPQRYHKCIRDIGEYEANNLGFATTDNEIFNVPIVTLKTFYYQRLISFIFREPHIRRSIIVAQYFNKPIIFPLKSDWIEIFEKSGFQFEKKTSSTFWKLLCIFIILRQLVQYILSFFYYKPCRNSNKDSGQNNSNKKVFFHDFPPGSILSKGNNLQYKNCLAWIKQNMPEHSGMVAFSKYGNKSHNTDHIKLTKIYGHIIIRKELLIISRLLLYILHNLKNYNNIGFLLLNLNEVLEFNRVLYYRRKILVNEVYFNCSMGATKPLWANATEKIGIESYILFYATYTEPRFRVNQVQLSGEWCLATWNNYIIPDLFLKSELQSVIPKIDQKFHIFGLAWWLDCEEVIYEEKKPTVVIFDRSPGISRYSFSLLAINGFDSYEYQEKFLSDILKAYENLDCLILYKSKRPINDFRYKQFLAKIKIESPLKFRVISDEFAPVRLIKNANIVISRAGSSTALLAKLEGKTSIIYDPTGIVNVNDPSYRGIPIIQNLMTLKSFVKAT
jgi:polysaccharide biosynthesis PFTS motif protein